MDASNHVHVYNFMTRELEYELDLKIKLSSVNISKNSLFLLVSKTDGESRIFNLQSKEPVKKFLGPIGGPNVIRSSFGGANEMFVSSGSEGRIDYII
jgi:WD40 repeat protein